MQQLFMLARNLGNSWEFDFGDSKPGICSEFVKFVQSVWKPQRNVLVRKMTSEIICSFLKNVET